MTNRGWISIHRQIENHWIWMDKPFSKGQAWLDLLMMANHQDNKFLLGNELVEVKRGSFITSEVKLMDRWGWSKTKLRSFLKLLEKEQMIVKKSDNKKTTLTICKYKDYQIGENTKETTKEQQKNMKKITEELPKDTNNNDNNENNENNVNNILGYGKDSVEYKLADLLRQKIKENNPLGKVPLDEEMDQWSKHMDYLMRIDGRSVEDIRKIIEFSQRDSFWMGNILNHQSLRAKFDQLYLKSRQSEKAPIQLVNNRQNMKTKFHLAKSRGEGYSAEELEEIVLRNQRKKLSSISREAF